MVQLPTYASNVCSACGASNSPGETICSSCGATLSVALPPPVSPVPVAMPPEPAQAIPPSDDTDADASDFYAIWGPHSSGKTMYLLMLEAHITRAPEWKMFPANPGAKRFLEEVKAPIFQHRYVTPTSVGKPEEYWFKFIKRETGIGPDREYVMRVLDMSGEYFEQPDKAVFADEDGEEKNVLKEYLYDCKGLLCLVDPDGDESDPMTQYLQKLLYNLYMETEQLIDKKIAFCLTKMDEPQHRPHLQNPGAYIRQKLGELMIRTIENYCAPGKVRFDFACSAVGHYHNPDETLFKPVRSNSGIDWQGRGIIYNSKNIKPFGLLDPLEKWLFVD